MKMKRKEQQKFYHCRRNEGQKKIRVGYLSPYFCFHAMMQLSIVFLSTYDKDRFELFVYMYGKNDEISNYLKNQVHGWHDIVDCAPDEAAKLIYGDRIDILMVVSGNADNKAIQILERKPAPIQMAGIGYYESTKCSSVDYFLGDVYLDDNETEKAFSEELLILPHSHLCYSPACRSASMGKTVHRLGENIIFSCIGEFAKMNGPVLSAWAKIMGQVEDARLVIIAEDFENKKCQKLAFQQMEMAGINLARVEVCSVTESYIVDFANVDIVLDAGSRLNGSLFCDALYMGVPVVSWKGNRHGERLGWSVLENIGMGELCVETVEEYAERAIMLAKDRELLAALHQNLRGMMEKSFLMDTKGYMESLEQGYQMAWKKLISCQKEVPSQEVDHLVPIMDEFVREEEQEQAFAVAEMILATRPQSLEIRMKIFFVYLWKNDIDSFETAANYFLEGDPFGNFLQARACFAKKAWIEARRFCQEVIMGGGLPYPWGGGEYQLLGDVCMGMGDASDAEKAYRCASFSKESKSVEERMYRYSKYLLTLHYNLHLPEFIYQESCRFCEFFAGRKLFVHHRRNHHKRLRIGYISPNFRHHAMACFGQAFFYEADKDRFEIYGYAKCKEDTISQRIAWTADSWKNVENCSTEEIAKLIYEDEIDILVELAGHTLNNSLPVLALRPAPVQLCGIGYTATTGLSCVDYFIVDKYTSTEKDDAFFSERILRLPHSHFCYTQVLDASYISRELPCERSGFVTFGSMDDVNKMGDSVLAAWGKIMKEIPDAHLFLKHVFLNDFMRQETEVQRLKLAGIDLSRVIIEGSTEYQIKEYSRIDITLDTFPYPGGRTTCDALYMGVPVISLAGNSNYERFGLSILANLGLDEELCAKTVEGYVDCAVRLARNKERLRELHASLRDCMERSPVMDQKLYMKDLESAYEDIWKKYEGRL